MRDNYEKYCELFKEILLIEDNDKLVDTSFEITYGWDSYAHMELITNIETEFGIKFSNEEVMKFMSFKDGLVILKERGINV